MRTLPWAISGWGAASLFLHSILSYTTILLSFCSGPNAHTHSINVVKQLFNETHETEMRTPFISPRTVSSNPPKEYHPTGVQIRESHSLCIIYLPHLPHNERSLVLPNTATASVAAILCALCATHGYLVLRRAPSHQHSRHGVLHHSFPRLATVHILIPNDKRTSNVVRDRAEKLRA